MEGARSIGALDNHHKKEGAGMSEYPNEQEQLKDPKPSGVSTNDDNYRGDVGDQGNDIRFAEEEALIREQSSPNEDEGKYTATEGAKTDEDREGGYTDSEGTQDGK
ncbi:MULTISPECIES: hypothetical protein [unclassified Arthrobacter]|uniref:hypothetical protein n=1 Tax=unclassified Arthrobacter TaxID=235627 RepID=UPI001D14F35C|nr:MULTISPECIES: hypothetical protein [unclassified Arthrobacter]MCC3289482.1 hypothetical protein [Arthrobacter sp. zg-Y1110]MCC3301001.1 hypothetical protein [Arthrobacter sp. zg-Y895]UWX85081.1 hypothetical protein N2K99_00400 [Arthrobacter sp. zg-Y1110]